MKTLLLTFSLLLTLSLNELKAQSTAKDLVFNIEISTSNSPASITLKWNTQVGVSSYNVLRKTRAEKTFTKIASDIQLADTVFTDNSIQVGNGYEYCVQSATNGDISGYVYAGIELPEVHQSGEIMLVVDDTYQQAAMLELQDYTIDLIKEGWTVHTVYVSRTQSVASVKQLILDEYNSHTSTLKGVILLGHVPVPYSGKIAPDAHTNHIGAWPSDMYYGDMQNSSIWTDQTLNVVTASDSRNFNVVGDGKFDASNKATTSAVKIFVGRVDVYNMPSISSNDVMLFKQYLTKNHAYRSGKKKYRQAGIIDDNFGYFSGEAFAQNGWRNFASLIGSKNITEGDLVSGTKSNSYIWSYACGPGWYTGAQGIGTTTDFASNQMQSVFTMTYGSYFGDWDNQDNFLRAPIASPSAALVSVWGGRPNWYFHTMALGEPIGYSYINSVDNANTYFPKGFYANKVHQSFQGDPTLKMYMFDAPTSVLTSLVESGTKVKVQWTASTDQEVLGYYVYRAPSVNDQFELLTPSFIEGTEFVDDSQGFDVEAIYMVKAVKLQQSTTGTFYNLSPGAMSLDNPVAVTLPVTITSFNGVMNDDQTNTLYWNVKDEMNLSGYEVEQSTDGISFNSLGFVDVKSNGQIENQYSFIDIHPAVSTSYRLKSIDIDGKSYYSSIINLRRTISTGDISFYPSPFTTNLHIQYPSDINTTLSISMFDINGRQIYQKSAPVFEGTNSIDLDGFESFTKGLYILSILNQETNSRQVFKVSKQ